MSQTDPSYVGLPANNPGETHAWEIVSVQDIPVFNGPAGATRVKRVIFQLFNGQQSYIDISSTDFANPEKVADLVDKHAAQMADVLNLKGPAITAQG